MASQDDKEPVYGEAFEKWARDILARAAARFPEKPPLTYEDFDGCTMVPDYCRHCCLIHDIACYYETGRLAADKALRDCMIETGKLDREWYSRAINIGRAWVWYGAVRGWGLLLGRK